MVQGVFVEKWLDLSVCLSRLFCLFCCLSPSSVYCLSLLLSVCLCLTPSIPLIGSCCHCISCCFFFLSHCLSVCLSIYFLHTHIQNELCVAAGPGKDMVESTKIIATKQYETGKVSTALIRVGLGLVDRTRARTSSGTNPVSIIGGWSPQ